jgi:hypothetical protein
MRHAQWGSKQDARTPSPLQGGAKISTGPAPPGSGVGRGPSRGAPSPGPANAQRHTVDISPPGPPHPLEHRHKRSHGPTGAQANNVERHDTSPAAHAARGPMSPLAGARPPVVVRRDEDFASAPMENVRAGKIPPTNARAGVTTIRGAHQPVAYPRSARESQKSGF